MYREAPASAKPKHPVLTLFLYMCCEDLFLQYHWNHLSSEVILSLPWLLLQTLRTVRNDAFWALDMIFFFWTAFFFVFTINSLQFSSHWLQILSYFLGMCLAFESPVFNANTFVSDSKPQYKSTALPSRWTQCFNVSWNAAFFYTPFNPFNATTVMGMQHSNGNSFQVQRKLPHICSLASIVTVLNYVLPPRRF